MIKSHGKVTYCHGNSLLDFCGNPDNLVIMAPIMEQLGRQVTDWRANLLGKGLKVNAGKYKVMVGSSGGKMIVNSGKWPCGVYGKGVEANSVQCTICKKID